MPFSTLALLTASLGFFIGVGVLPVLSVARLSASRLVPTGVWLHMLLTMILWMAAMTLLGYLLNLLFATSLPHYARRHNAIFLVVGVMLGLTIGGFVTTKLISRNR